MIWIRNKIRNTTVIPQSELIVHVRSSTQTEFPGDV